MPKWFSSSALGLLCCNFCSLHSHKYLAKAKWNEIAKSEERAKMHAKNQDLLRAQIMTEYLHVKVTVWDLFMRMLFIEAS